MAKGIKKAKAQEAARDAEYNVVRKRRSRKDTAEIDPNRGLVDAIAEAYRQQDADEEMLIKEERGEPETLADNVHRIWKSGAS